MKPDIVHIPQAIGKKRLPPIEMVLFKPPSYSKQSENCLFKCSDDTVNPSKSNPLVGAVTTV